MRPLDRKLRCCENIYQDQCAQRSWPSYLLALGRRVRSLLIALSPIFLLMLGFLHKYRFLRLLTVVALYFPFLHWSLFYTPLPALRTVQDVAPGSFNLALAPDGYATGRQLKTNVTTACPHEGHTSSLVLMRGLHVDVDAATVRSASNPHLEHLILPQENHTCRGRNNWIKWTGPEDARILVGGTKQSKAIYYNDAIDETRYIAFRTWENGQLSKEIRLNYSRALSEEKNWVPFELQDDLERKTTRLSYRIHPTHRVIQCNNQNGLCVDEFETSNSIWPYNELLGYLRPGSAPIPISRDEMFAVAHFTSYEKHQGKNWLTRLWYPTVKWYCTVFYTFERRPPFKVIRMSRPLKFFPDRIEYAMSAFLVHDRQTLQKTLVMSWGIGDNRNIVGFLDWREVDQLMRWNRVDSARWGFYLLVSYLILRYGSKLATVPFAFIVIRNWRYPATLVRRATGGEHSRTV